MALIKRNTAYNIGDIVETTFGVKLVCKVAGTTANSPLVITPPQ